MIERTVVKMRLFFVAIAPLVALLSWSCEPSCQNEVLAKISSPNGQVLAIVFSRNCGATTGDNLQVAVVKANESFAGKGNALILDETPSYSDVYSPQWTNDRSLTLTVPKGARVFLQRREVNGVQIAYRLR